MSAEALGLTGCVQFVFRCCEHLGSLLRVRWICLLQIENSLRWSIYLWPLPELLCYYYSFEVHYSRSHISFLLFLLVYPPILFFSHFWRPKFFYSSGYTALQRVPPFLFSSDEGNSSLTDYFGFGNIVFSRWNFLMAEHVLSSSIKQNRVRKR